jgi:orotidine-5'-phosphate decarboxylase
MIPFPDRLFERILRTNSRVCLGIDPRPEAHPSTRPKLGDDPAQTAKAVVRYFRDILEATQGALACVKLQSAFFERLGIPGLIAMAQLLADAHELGIPAILDAKRGDVGETAAAYAEAYLGGGVFAADALTVNPYLGMDALEPFVAAAQANGRGLFVLVKTSNPGAGDFQDVPTADGSLVFEQVAYRLAARARDLKSGGGYALLGAVAGATYPQELAHLRETLPQSVLLVPGYGAQGAGPDDVVAAFDEDGLGAVVSASRSLAYASQDGSYALAAQSAVREMRAAINQAIGLE